MRRTFRATLVAVVTLTGISLAQTANSPLAVPAQQGSSPLRSTTQTPNILFIIMDDVGIDQMQVFGYGGGTASATPNIDTIAHAGLRFRNVWAMPECSPSRAIYFEGRFPLRTNIYNAILSIDLANSQLSPYEVTTPNVLRDGWLQQRAIWEISPWGWLRSNEPLQSVWARNSARGRFRLLRWLPRRRTLSDRYHHRRRIPN